MKNNYFSEEQFLEKLKELRLKVDTIEYEFDKEGHIIRLDICGAEGLYLDYFPEQICELKLLRELVFSGHSIRRVPECLKKLANLAILDLSDNKLHELPPLIESLPNLEVFFVADKNLNIPHRNLLVCLNVEDLNQRISLKHVSAMYEEFRKREQAERDDLTRKYNERQEPWKLIYPPKEILSSPQNCKYIILWMLNNNFACMWGDFRDEPISMNQHLVSKYIDTLSHYDLIYRVDRTAYMITELGKKRLCEIENSRSEIIK